MEYRIVRALSHADEDQKYGIPEQKKFPMPDARHVRSAIRFFNYVDPSHEEELANAIKNRMKEYGLTFDDFTVGPENRFSKYIPKDELEHHGIIGMKWGIRRYQNPDGTLTEAGKKHYARQEERKERAAEAATKKLADRKAKADRDAALAEINKLKKQDPSKLTDEELNKLQNRLNLEKQVTDYDSKRKELLKKKTSKLTDNELRYLLYRKDAENRLKQPAVNTLKGMLKTTVSEAAKPALVAAGKAAIIAMLTDDKNFKSTMYKLYTNSFSNNQNQNQNQGNKQEKKKQDSKGERSISMFNTYLINEQKPAQTSESTYKGEHEKT